MPEKTQYQILKEIVKTLNGKGRTLKFHQDPDPDQFIILRIREKAYRKILGFIPIPTKGAVVYESPVKSYGEFGYTNDRDIIDALHVKSPSLEIRALE